ncbi:hypothetical protein G6O67_004132 [Ophiocordyceps sinensis]|uniref:Alcohol dehydrogenase-like N-terminal domain-containing protein n=2 Tax=Ophiocordyceps sinensis TaxID=72228 RepID=A0A8H4PNT8_9HYPO|nr:zinc-binding dehydrogenase family oxidoreductase [Ophiocordyceps sinensis CO18]KAF4507656.1 hypothetical protein G6O67_004132 [Ophiocordyceps sinensis]
MTPKTQTALVQSRASSTNFSLSFAIEPSCPLADSPSPYHVLVRVCAVSLNPSDWKAPKRFFVEGNGVGCDFCGFVEEAGPLSKIGPRARVCGAIIAMYKASDSHKGAFAQYTWADSRRLLRVPESWSAVQAAALGAVSWSTSGAAISDPEALGLAGLPSKPADKPIPVLVYGGATATGIMTTQLLKLSGYLPIAVCSPKSSALVKRCGAVGTASYLSSSIVQDIKKIAHGVPIRHAIDCVTTPESVSDCMSVIARTGGRYACLEVIPETCVLRRAVKVKVVMAYETENVDTDLNHPVYSRKANAELHGIVMTWTKDIQSLLDRGALIVKPLHELNEGFEGIIEGLDMLRRGDLQDRKLVAVVPS